MELHLSTTFSLSEEAKQLIHACECYKLPQSRDEKLHNSKSFLVPNDNLYECHKFGAKNYHTKSLAMSYCSFTSELTYVWNND